MILITGGIYQGKRLLAEKILRQRWKTEADCQDRPPEDRDPVIWDAKDAHCTVIPEHIDILDHLECFLLRCMKNGTDYKQELKKLTDENPDVIIILQEMGCGVVPIDAGQRRFRELCGRTGCDLAVQAREVWLSVCGIGNRLK